MSSRPARSARATASRQYAIGTSVRAPVRLWKNPAQESQAARRGGSALSVRARLEHAGVHDFLGQRVLEAEGRRRILPARKDEVEAVELSQVSIQLGPVEAEDARKQRHAEAAPHDRRALQRLLERLCQAVDAGRDDVLDGRGHRDTRAAEPRLALLDDDASRLLELA